jgi:dCMP deaminase
VTRELRDSTLMSVAILFGQRSTCDRAPVGAVIAREGRILTTGYNGAPSGMAHCVHIPGDLVDKSGDTRSTCSMAVHAEANAIAYAARFGITTDGTDLFTTLSPCLECAKLIINAGVVRVVYKHKYRDTRGIEFLELAGVEVERR